MPPYITIQRKKIKWTYGIRLFLYQTLTMNFGPHDGPGWPHVTPKEYETALGKMVKYISEQYNCSIGSPKNPDGIEAIKQQIAWAITDQNEVRETQEFTLYGNKAAAKEAGFIK